jgi:hypothetical protein
MWPSGESLTNYVALQWADVGQPLFSEKIVFPLPGIEPKFLARSARNLVTTPHGMS